MAEAPPAEALPPGDDPLMAAADALAPAADPLAATEHDPFADFDDTPPAVPEPAPVQRQCERLRQRRLRPPSRRSRSLNHGSTGAAPTQAAAPSAAETAAVAAFFEAAGAGDLKLSDEEMVETMRRVGAAFGAMVSGLREVLMTRASIKGEFRMNQTMIQSGGNNPLKFSISPEQALRALIKPEVPGYLPADRAASEALDDIKAHEVAMMTGMEAALGALIKRFDPEALAARMEKTSST